VIRDEGGSRSPEFLSDGGEMGALMRAHDWTRSPVGQPARWPDSLKMAVSILLNSRFPMVIFWGPEFTVLYNDAWRPILGTAKHPKALGSPGIEVWPEIWDIIGVQLGGVLKRGEATWSENLLLPLERYSYLEEAYFTYSYSPIKAADGRVGGVFTAVFETTERVLSERRMRILRELAARTAESKSVREACRTFAEVLGENNPDIPFALLYLVDDDGRGVSLAASAGLQRSNYHPAGHLALDGNDGWSIARAVRHGEPVVLDDLHLRVAALPAGIWPEPTTQAIVLPVAKSGQHAGVTGVLIGGINPRRALDIPYRRFFDLVAAQMATAVANSRAYEEERRRSEALAEIDRAKTSFFSNASHEFRTPLSLMLGPLEDMLVRHPTAATIVSERRDLEIMHRNGLRLLKLVNTLLDFSRIEAGRIQAVYEPIDLAVYTAEVASNFRSAMTRAGLRFTIDCPPLSGPVYVDRDMWEKIVLNLVSNAFKYTFEGEVAVALRPAGPSVELVVRDTGVGIPEPELPRLFERFYRVEGQQGRTMEGTGIGLALVQELVRLHGGTVWAQSVLGSGTTFTVMIPTGTAHLPRERIGGEPTMAPTGVQAEAFVEEAIRSLPGGGAAREVAIEKELISPRRAVAAVERATVLVADDNADMLEYVRRLLAARYEVEAVPDGQAALDAARARRPDLILTDVMMPRLDGFGLLQAIRIDGALRDVPVVLLSARAGEEAKVEGLEAGADDYLLKPFSARELIARVDANLQLARLRREIGESERRYHEVQMELAHANRVATTGQLSASIAHEVTQPIAAVVNNARAGLNWLDAQPPNLEEVRQTFEAIISDGRRADGVIGRIRALIKKAPPRKEDLEINEAVLEVIALTRAEVLKNGVSVRTQLAESLPLIRADRVQLQQVILNLILNAIEAMSGVGEGARELLISTRKAEPNGVLVGVRDSGPGLAPALLERVFDAFYTTKSGGLGMGLSICRSIIEAHGGRLWASTNAPPGATFEFTVSAQPDITT
jgi:signal transduction histidine kinase